MARSVRLLATTVLVLSVGLPAGAHEEAPPGACHLIRGAATPDTADDVHVCRQDVWFHAGQAKPGNTGAVSGSFPTFDTTKPSASVTAGAGGGYVASSATHQSGTPWDERLTATFDGNFTGDIDNLAVTAYFFNPPEDAQSIPTIAMNIRLVVDGQSIFETGGEIPRQSGGTAVKKVDFALTGLYQPMLDAGLTGHDRAHKVRFQISGTGLASEAAVFVYDTTEVPSGMVFNIEPEQLSKYTVFSAAGE